MKKLSLHASLQAETYLKLQKLNYLSRDVLYKILNDNGAANLTVCPSCKVDDFVHVVGCPLQPTGEQAKDWHQNSQTI